jgi:hypothetical protein
MTLNEFAADWLRNTALKPPVSAYERAGENVGFTLYRDGPFQVQMWTLPPHAEVTEHKHPEVDSYLVRVGGRLRLKLNGAWIPLDAMGRTCWLGMRTWGMRIRPDDLHGVEVGREGGSFLVISKRIDGQPARSVHLSWEGPALDAAHQAALEGV